MPLDKRNRSKYHRDRRLRTVVWLRSLRHKCVHCGETDPVVLDFHHRDAAKKSFQLVGGLCYSRSTEVILREVAKCDVLCSNCHRREEYRLRKLCGIQTEDELIEDQFSLVLK